jgi:hypothetical protein
VVNGLVEALLIIDREAKVGAKKNQKVFLDSVTTKRSEVLKERDTHRKQKKELCKSWWWKDLVRC